MAVITDLLQRPSITRMEAGNRAVSALELTRLAELYRRPVTWFLSKQDMEGHDAFVTLHCAAIGLEDAPESKRQVDRCIELCRKVIGLQELLDHGAARRADLFRTIAAGPLGWLVRAAGCSNTCP